MEYRVIQPTGEVRTVHSRGEVTRDSSGRPYRMFGSVQDITERKRAEQRRLAQYRVTQILAEAPSLEVATPQLLQALCEGLAWDLGALWHTDRQAGVLRCVAFWRRASFEAPGFETASRAMTFRPGCGLPGSVWLTREPAYFSDFSRDTNFPRTPMAAAEGLRAACAFPILLGGEVLGVIEFFSREMRPPDADLLNMMVTIDSQIGQFIERQRAEEALQQAQAELLHLTRVTTLGELTASIAHEVNQPLAGILTNASASLRWLAGETPNLAEARQAIHRIVRDGNRASDVITRMRALFKKTPAAKEPVDVNEIIQEVLAVTQNELQRNRVSLRTEFAKDLPMVIGDKIQLQQVILNLVVNAIEAMRGVGEGSRELCVNSQKSVGISGETGSNTVVGNALAESQSASVLIAVRDSGPGLDSTQLQHVFEAYYTTKSQGMGMGLPISRSIIEAHGGRLWAKTNTPCGALFEFTLPVPDPARI